MMLSAQSNKLDTRPDLLWKVTESQPCIGSLSLSCCAACLCGVGAEEQGTGIGQGKERTPGYSTKG